MKSKILVGAFHHESNSFNPIVSSKNDFNIFVGDELFHQIKDNDSLSGIITTLLENEIEVIPTISMRGVPNGEVDQDLFLSMKTKMMEMASKHKLDGICLALHGSMRVAGLGEAEGLILEELRALFPNIPIFVALDMHASMSEKMIKHCDGFVGYKTAPHIDCSETGVQAAQMLLTVLNLDKPIFSSTLRIPMIVAGEKSASDVYPMTKLIDALKEAEKDEEVLSASYLLGFPWSDNPDNRVSVHVVSTNSQKECDELCLYLARLFWSHRHDFKFVAEAYKPKEALDKALETVKEGIFPVYISDSGDNPTAGASADNTHFLNLMLDNCHLDILDNTVIYAGFHDPMAVEACLNKEGEYLHLTFGAHFDAQLSQPVTQIVFVKKVLENTLYRGQPAGTIVLIQIVNLEIILTQKHIGFTETQMFTDLGINASKHPIIICKLGYLTPSHAGIAKKSIFALTSGHTQQDLESIPYENVTRPVYPLDKHIKVSFE